MRVDTTNWRPHQTITIAFIINFNVIETKLSFIGLFFPSAIVKMIKLTSECLFRAGNGKDVLVFKKPMFNDKWRFKFDNPGWKSIKRPLRI